MPDDLPPDAWALGRRPTQAELRELATPALTYVPVKVRKAMYHRVERDGVTIGGIAELEDHTCAWHTRAPARPGGGDTRTLDEAKAALEAHLRGR